MKPALRKSDLSLRADFFNTQSHLMTVAFTPYKQSLIHTWNSLYHCFVTYSNLAMILSCFFFRLLSDLKEKRKGLQRITFRSWTGVVHHNHLRIPKLHPYSGSILHDVRDSNVHRPFFYRYLRLSNRIC